MNSVFICFLLVLIPSIGWGDTADLFMSMYDRIDNATAEAPNTASKYLSVYRSVNAVYLGSKIEALRAQYDAAVAREQSLGNRILGAVSIGATGIGGMELASGLAEKNADADAEQDMRAYLETIKCDYGQGLNIRGGETNIELPGGNEWAELYSQYVALAADLKARKESLGLKPGLESELILDKESTGLYDDVGVGITGGAYASVSRALMDETGDDAAAWNAQKEESQKKIKAGAITAGAGAGAGTVGNLIEDATNKKRNSANQN